MTYCYHCARCSRTFEVHRSMKDCTPSEPCPECKAEAERDYQAEGCGTQKKTWEHHSFALAENDVKGASERAKKHGVPTKFDDIGCPIFTSQNHQRNYLKMMRKNDFPVIDRNAYC